MMSLSEDCQHEEVIARRMEMADGRPMIREVCTHCGECLRPHLPQQNDVDVPIMSYKYPGKTLGEVPRDYLEWTLYKSKAPNRVKNAARRILAGAPYTVPEFEVPYKRRDL